MSLLDRFESPKPKYFAPNPCCNVVADCTLFIDHGNKETYSHCENCHAEFDRKAI